MVKMLKLILMLFAVTMAYGSHEEEEHEPQPYHFGYDVKGEHGTQYHQEKSDGHGHVEGSYGYTDEKGIYREVQYVADDSGFRAKVITNEPGTKDLNPADVTLESSAKQDGEHYEHAGYNSLHGSEYRNSESPILLKESEYRYGNSITKESQNGNGDSSKGSEYRNSDSSIILKRQGEHGGHE